MRALLIALALGLAGCSDVNPFYCDDSDQCVLDGVQGTCTEYFQCAFPDDSCTEPPHLRYHPDSEVGDVCVGEEEDFE